MQTLEVFLQASEKQFILYRACTPMETCSRAGIIGLWGLDIQPKNLCSLIFRVLLKLLGRSPSLLKTFREDEHVHSPPVGIEVSTLPELPQDILMAIFATLEIPDLTRTGSVCSSWRSAYSQLRNLAKYKLSQTPCLLYTSESAGEDVAFLYSLVEKRAYKLALPEPPIRSRFIIGSSHGWLVTVDDRSEMHLLNPITGEQVALPSVITMEHVNPVFNKYGAVDKYEYLWHTATEARYTPSIFALSQLRDYLQCKAFVFPEISRGSYIVVLIHNPLSQLSFARVGDDRWTWLPPHTDYEDCNYKNGLLYALTMMGQIHAFDINGPVITMKMITGMTESTKCDNMYIVEAPWGDLLNVWRMTTEEHEGEDRDVGPATLVRYTEEIEIYKIDAMTKELVELKCIHDHVLILGYNQSLCLSAEEYPSLKANHVYFTDNHELWLRGYKNNRRDIGVLNLDGNIREELVSPQLWSNWPAPVWITPSLVKMNIH